MRGNRSKNKGEIKMRDFVTSKMIRSQEPKEHRSCDKKEWSQKQRERRENIKPLPKEN